MSTPAASSKPPSFYPFIHILRGMAPLIVVWAHLAMLFVIMNGIEWQGAAIWQGFFVKPLHLFQNAGHLGVVLFFFVSGFIITHSSLGENRREFAIKRILRIFPILAVALALTALSRWISASLGLGEVLLTQPGSLKDYIEAFFLYDMVAAKPQLLAVTWSLVTEVMFYAMTFMVLGSSKTNPERATYVMIAVWAGIEMVWSGIPRITYLHFFTIYLGLLIMGRVLYLADTGIVGWRKSVPMLLLIAGLFTMFHTNVQTGILFGAAPEPGAAYVLAFLIFLCCMTYGASKVPRVLAFVANISLSLYLLHIPVGMLVMAATYKVTQIFPIALIVGVTASIAASYLAFRFVEMPCQRLARRLTKGRRSPVTAPSIS